MPSALPGLKEPFIQKLDEQRIRVRKLPAILMPAYFASGSSPYSAQAAAQDTQTSLERSLSEVLSLCDSDEVKDHESYLTVTARGDPVLLNHKSDGTLSHMHLRLAHLRKKYAASLSTQDAEDFIREIVGIQEEFAALDLQLILKRINEQRKSTGFEELTRKDLDTVLPLVPYFQTSFVEHILQNYSSETIRSFYRMLSAACPHQRSSERLTDILLRRYDKFFSSRMRQALRQFKALIKYIGRESRLGSTETVSEGFQLAAKTASSFSQFKAFCLDDSFTLNPLDECFFIWQQEKHKILPSFLKAYAGELTEIISRSEIARENVNLGAETSFEESSFTTRGGSEIKLSETELSYDGKNYLLAEIDSLFYCASNFKADQNTPSCRFRHWGFRMSNGEEVRFAFDEESEWQSFIYVFRNIAMLARIKKFSELLKEGGTLKFMQCRISDLGVEFPQKEQFWGRKSFNFYPWKDILIEFFSQECILHGGPQKAYINLWNEPYITDIASMLRAQKTSHFDRLSAQNPIFLIKRDTSWS